MNVEPWPSSLFTRRPKSAGTAGEIYRRPATVNRSPIRRMSMDISATQIATRPLLAAITQSLSEAFGSNPPRPDCCPEPVIFRGVCAEGDVYIFQPRADRGWNPHTSYDRDGTLHMKSHDFKVLPPHLPWERASWLLR